MKLLIIAAHPDDEVLGAGGTVARAAAAGAETAVLVLGEGATSRPEGDRQAVDRLALECRLAAEELGVTELVQLTYPDNRFDSVDLLEIVRSVEREIARVGPSIVITHHPGDVNVDHRRTHEAVLAATRPIAPSPVRHVLTFEVPSSTEWGSPSVPFVPTVFVDIADTLETKVSALRCYRSELRDHPHPRSVEGVRSLARVRGSTAGMAAAEAFSLVRAAWR